MGNIEYVKDLDKRIINIKIPLSLENQLKVESFINQLKDTNIKQIVENWFFDEKNHIVENLNKKFLLTKKESTFMKLLLNNKIVTYEQMIYYIWESKPDISQDAIKCFVKNFKKKMPPSKIKNMSNIGYFLKLI